jgi:uncharacterized protein YrrD
MLILSNALLALPIVTLQDGQAVATIDSLIIGRSGLDIIAFWCTRKSKRDKILMARDIRYIARDCILINDLDDLTTPSDIVRLPAIIKDSYDPIGKRLVTQSGTKLGKIDNYTINLDSGVIQKLYAQPTLLKSWFGSSVIVDRNQIVDLQETAVIVKDATVDYAESSKANLISAKPKP